MPPRAPDGTFPSCNNIDTIAYYCYPQQGELKGIVQISHGMCEYLTRYDAFACALNQAGYLVCGSDHLGHGNSASSPEELGYFAGGDAYDLLPRDLHTLTSMMKKQYPGVPYFLFGHSMGSFVARLYLTRYGEELSGAILCGTSGPVAGSRLGILLAGLVGSLKGDHYRAAFLENLAFGAYNKRYETVTTPSDWISRDGELVRRYREDPYCLFTFTAKGFHDLFTMVTMVNKKQWAQSLPKSLPVYLVAGDMDPVGQYGKGVTLVRDRLLAAGLADVSMTLYPESRHELLNDLDKKRATADILGWLDRHIPTKNDNK